MRLIDADALFINLDGMMAVSPTGYIHGDTVADMISDAPTVDAVPVIDIEPAKHGKWKLIRMEDNGDGFYTCSNCDRGDIHSPLVTVPYCWYCGARMDAERKEE